MEKITPENANKEVLMICPFARPNVGGVETHLDKLIRFLKKKKVFVYLITYQPLTTKARGVPVEKGENFLIFRTNWFGQGWFNKIESSFPLTFLYLVPGLLVRSIIFYAKNHHQIDVIHAHGFAAAFIARALNLIRHKRTVVSTHAIYNLSNRRLLALLVCFLLKPFEKILAVSEAAKTELIRIGLNPKNIEVHPNWIDLETFVSSGREKCKRRLRLPNKVVLFVGRLIEKKGIPFLLKAAKKFPRITFIFVGSGPMELIIKRTSERLKNIIFVGQLSQNKKEELKYLIDLYSAADLFACVPTYPEGFGAVYLETIACGTPVLGSKVGSLPTFLDRKVAALIEPNQQNINTTIAGLFEDRGRLTQIQSACRPYAEKNFSERNAQIIYESYFK